LIATFARAGLCAGLVLGLSACSYLFGDEGLFPDESEDYKEAREMPVITVPEGMSSESIQELYKVPAVEDNLVLAGDFDVPRPAPLVAAAADQMVRIQRLGEEQWALIGEPPGQVWPQIRSFLAALQVQVARVDAREGIIETGWITLDSSPMASRFQFRIDQGVQRGNSELHVLQQHQTGNIERWPASSDNTQQEADMLQGVAQYIANSSETAPVSMIADQSIQASGRISLQEAPEGYTYIQLGLPYDRAWASVEKALRDSSFEVTDRDRSAGEYRVRFKGLEQEDDGGWFGWLFDEEEHPLTGRNFLVTVQPATKDAVTVRLRPSDGQPLEQREEQSLLSLLKGNIN
jgi:outer membrane protein assembly factor BamC